MQAVDGQLNLEFQRPYLYLLESDLRESDSSCYSQMGYVLTRLSMLEFNHMDTIDGTTIGIFLAQDDYLGTKLYRNNISFSVHT